MVLRFCKEPEQNKLVSGQFVKKRERWVGEKQKLS